MVSNKLFYPVFIILHSNRNGPRYSHLQYLDMTGGSEAVDVSENVQLYLNKVYMATRAIRALMAMAR